MVWTKDRTKCTFQIHSRERPSPAVSWGLVILFFFTIEFHLSNYLLIQCRQISSVLCRNTCIDSNMNEISTLVLPNLSFRTRFSTQDAARARVVSTLFVHVLRCSSWKWHNTVFDWAEWTTTKIILCIDLCILCYEC